jgi:epoxyqueuosine reductase
MKTNSKILKLRNSKDLKSFIRSLGIDLVGIADLRTLEGMPIGLPLEASHFFKIYPRAIVLGAQLGKMGKKALGREVSAFLEKAGLQAFQILEENGYRGVIVHIDEEYDPVRRYGLMSLKVLAKAAGLGWQGRSLLIISPEYGPIHRLIAILTNMPLKADKPISNRCGYCSRCIDYCPARALTLVPFKDHPKSREQVLDIKTCWGDDACLVCLSVCPWVKKSKASSKAER